MTDLRLQDEVYWRGNIANYEWWYGVVLAINGEHAWVKPTYHTSLRRAFAPIDRKHLAEPRTLFIAKLLAEPKINRPLAGILPHLRLEALIP